MLARQLNASGQFAYMQGTCMLSGHLHASRAFASIQGSYMYSRQLHADWPSWPITCIKAGTDSSLMLERESVSPTKHRNAHCD